MLARTATRLLRPSRLGLALRCHGGTGDSSLPPVGVVFVDKHGEEHAVQGYQGEHLLDCAKRHDLEMEGACEASIACSTCHVILEREKFNLLEEASEEEEDMLDMAFGLKPTSRLGCQVFLTPELEGMRIQLPMATRNFYVDGAVPTSH